MKILQRNFYARNTEQVALELLGKILINGKTAGMIVEAEAYYGKNDPGSHAYRGITKRNEVMFGPPGFSYIYFCYGNHYLFNVVTEKPGIPGAVLVRALMPLEGIKIMQERRNTNKEKELCNGPGKLTQALGLSKLQNNINITKKPFCIADKGFNDFEIQRTTRIGIKQGADLKLRFYIKGNEYISKT